jgi:transcriptional regulator with XRE-family HTH domain
MRVIDDVFPSRLRQARVEAGLSIRELADKVGMESRQTANRWEEGTRLPDVRTLARIALTLHTSMDWLLGLDELEGQAPSARVFDLQAALFSPDTIFWRGRPVNPAMRVQITGILRLLFSSTKDLLAGQEWIRSMAANDLPETPTLPSTSPSQVDLQQDE